MVPSAHTVRDINWTRLSFSQFLPSSQMERGVGIVQRRSGGVAIVLAGLSGGAIDECRR